MKYIQTAVLVVQVAAVILALGAVVLAFNLLVALFCLLELAKLARSRIRSIIFRKNTASSVMTSRSIWKRQPRS
jgi:hypothetical protein